MRELVSQNKMIPLSNRNTWKLETNPVKWESEHYYSPHPMDLTRFSDNQRKAYIKWWQHIVSRWSDKMFKEIAIMQNFVDPITGDLIYPAIKWV